MNVCCCSLPLSCCATCGNNRLGIRNSAVEMLDESIRISQLELIKSMRFEWPEKEEVEGVPI